MSYEGTSETSEIAEMSATVKALVSRAMRALGKRGGEARARNLDSDRKLDIARKAAAARWDRKLDKDKDKDKDAPSE